MPHAALDVVIRFVVVLSMLFSQLTPLVALAKPLADSPVADFAATPTGGDAPLTVAFSNNSTAATLYEWNFGDGTTSSEATPDHTYTQSGLYSVSLQAGDGTVTDTLTDYISVSEPAAPVAAFSADPLSGSVPLNVVFSNASSNADSYTWDFGDGTGSSEANPTHIFTQPGTYSVTLTAVAGSGQTDTATANIIVAAANLLLNGDFESGDFDLGDQEAWYLSSGNISIDPTASHSGLYGAKMIEDGHIDQVFDTVPGETYYVSAWMRLDEETQSPTWGGVRLLVTDSSWAELAESDRLTAANSPVGEWVFEEFSFEAISSEARVAFQNFSDGVLNASLDDIAVSLVPPTPLADQPVISPAGGTFSGPVTVELTSSTENAAIYYTLDGSSPTSGSNLYSAPLTVTGSTTVRAIATASGYDASQITTAEFTISEPVPTADFAASPLSGTAPLTVTFTNNSVNASIYAWDFGDGTTSSETNPTHAYPSTGIYTVTLQAGDSVVTDTLSRVGYLTVITSGASSGEIFWDDFDPVRETWTHTAAQGVDDWTLSTAYAHSPTHAFFSQDIDGLKDDYLLSRAFVVPTEAELTFWHTFETELGGDGGVIEISTDGGSTFTDLGPHITGGGYTDQIDTGWGSPISGRMAWTGGSLGSMTQVVIDLSTYTGQSAMLRFRMTCDSGVGSVGWYIDDIQVTGTSAGPMAIFDGSPLTGSVPLTVTFVNSSIGASAYAWDFGDGTTSSETNPSHTYTQPGSYMVTLTASDGVLTDTASTLVEVTTLDIGLQAYWPLDEESGLRYDQSGQHNDLTPVGTVSSVPGKIGRAADFGYYTEDYLTIDSSLQTGLNITGSLTLVGWLKINEATPDWAHIAGIYDARWGGTDKGYWLSYSYDDRVLLNLSEDGSASTGVTMDDPLIIGQWHHIAAVFDAEQQMVKLYQDGSLSVAESVGVNSVHLSAKDFRLMAGNNAQLDEWRVYDRALSQTEIQTLMDQLPANFSAAPLTGLAPLTVTFTSDAPGATGFDWDFGDGTTSSEANPTHTYLTPGVYTVTLSAGDGALTNTLAKPGYITVEQVTADFSAFPLAGPAPLSILFFNSSTNATDYLWDFGDGATSTEANPSHTYTTAGVYTVSLTASDRVTSDTLVRPEHITAYSSSSLELALAFGANTWTRATANEPGINYTKVTQNGQNFNYSAGQGYGYTNIDNIDTTPNNRAVYSGSDELYDQFIGVANGGYIVFRVDLPNGRYRFVAAGGDALYDGHATTIEIQDGVDGQVLTLVKDYVPAAAGDFWTVEFDDKVVPPADGSGADPVFVSQLDSGILEVTQGYLQVFQRVGNGGNNGGDLSLLEVWRLVEAQPQPNLAISKTGPAAVEAGQPITYTLTVTNSGSLTATNVVITDALPAGATYAGGGDLAGGVVSWSAGNLAPGTSVTVNWAVTASATITNGNYGVTAAGVAVTGSEPVVTLVTLPLVADFSAFPLSGPIPLSVVFFNSSTNATDYLWDFGDGTISTEASPTHTYETVGVYTVVLTAGNSSGTDTATQTITAGAPVLAISKTGPAEVEAGQPITYTLTVTNNGDMTATNVVITDVVPAGATYVSGGDLAGGVVSWFAGNLAPGTSVTVNWAVTASTTITNNDYGATAEEVAVTGSEPVVTLVTLPLVADFSAFPHQAGAPALVQFMDNSSGPITAYAWDFGDGLISTLASPTHTYVTAGVYTVSLTVSSATDSATLTRPDYITVTQPVMAGFTATPLTGAAPLTITFSNLSTGATGYLWDFGDSITSTVISPTHTYQTLGEYTVVLTATNPTGTDVASQTITVTGAPALAIGKTGPAAVEAGQPITYTLTVTNSGSLTATNLVITDAIPVGATYVSDGSLIGGNVVSWSVPSLAAGATVTETFAVTATQSITNSDYAVIADGGLSVVGQAVVTTEVYLPPLVDFSATPLTGTVPLTVTFVNSSTHATDYLWDFGDGVSSFILPPSSLTLTHVYTVAGVYTVSLTAASDYLSQTLTRTNYITTVEPISREWRLLTTTVSPPVIGEHALTYDPTQERVVLYGGNAAGWPYESATWEFDGTDWLTVTTTAPLARYGAGLAYDGSRVILFGGGDENDVALNQTWVYTNAAWSELQISGPVSRTYHSLATGPNDTIYLFGGNDGDSYFNDLWKFENGGWSQLTISGDQPAARTLAALTYDTGSDRLLLFGGRTATGTLLADLWAFDLATTTWQLLDDGGGSGPPARMGHTLTYDPVLGNVILVGGVAVDGDTWLDDVWLYNDSGWTQAAADMPLPSGAYHQAVYTDNAIILFSNGQGWSYE